MSPHAALRHSAPDANDRGIVYAKTSPDFGSLIHSFASVEPLPGGDDQAGDDRGGLARRHREERLEGMPGRSQTDVIPQEIATAGHAASGQGGLSDLERVIGQPHFTAPACREGRVRTWGTEDHPGVGQAAGGTGPVVAEVVIANPDRTVTRDLDRGDKRLLVERGNRGRRRVDRGRI